MEGRVCATRFLFSPLPSGTRQDLAAGISVLNHEMKALYLIDSATIKEELKDCHEQATIVALGPVQTSM